ncbi:type IV pilus biogenesis protein PilM [Pseudomonas putida]
MLGRLGKDAGSLLGVEIAPACVRILQLHRRQGRCKVAAWAWEPFDAVAGGDWLRDPGRVLQALRTACMRSGSRQRRVAVALPASQVICKLCQVPARQARAQMEAQLLADAARLFPFALEDLALDFQVLGASKAQADCLDVLVAACRQSALEPLVALFEEAGLQVAAVEVDSIALRRMLPVNVRGGSALLRLEAGSATLHCWSQGGLVQRHDLRPGMHAIHEQALERIELMVAGGQLAEELLVVGSPALEPGWHQHLAARLSVPLRQLPALPGLEPTDDSMVLACALALGGVR